MAIGRKLGSNRWTGVSILQRVVTDIGLANQLQDQLIADVFKYPFRLLVLLARPQPFRPLLYYRACGGTNETIQFLAAQAPQLHPVLVMDRWFAIP